MVKTVSILFGCGEHGRVVIDAIASTASNFELILDDHPHCATVQGTKVIASSEAYLAGLAPFRFVVGIGDNVARGSKYKLLRHYGGEPFSVHHASSIISPTAKIGLGSVTMAGSVINPGAQVGEDCIVNTSSSIDHDCRIGSHVHICPGVRLAGCVTVGDGVLIGTGAVVIPGVTIGAWSVVGAGSVVVRDVPERCVVFGNPARIIRRL